MINKTRIFADQGQKTGSNLDAQYREGMVPQEIAKAEDVNELLGYSDQQLYAVCNEIVKLLELYGVEPQGVPSSEANFDPDAPQNKQLATLFKDKINSGRFLTGVVHGSFPVGGTAWQNGAEINIPSMTIVYNKQVLYGDTIAEQQTTTLPATTLRAAASWNDGVYFAYAQTTVDSNVSSVVTSQERPQPEDSQTKCYLGSFFVVGGAIQADSWWFEPWLQITSPETRENPSPATMGGFISPATATTLQMGAFQAMYEGVNYSVNPFKPNTRSFNPAKPYTYKWLFPGYNPATSASTNLNTRAYALQGATPDAPVELIDLDPAQWGTDKRYMVIVPCITPTGQTLMVPATGKLVNGEYTQVFKSQNEAINAVYGLEYGEGFKTVAARSIFLGQSLIIQVGADNLLDPEQYTAIGQLPQALAGFSTASGQSGGGAGEFIPMPEITYPASTQNITARNNAANIILGNAASAVTVNPPSVQAGRINQFSVKYTHDAGKQGIVFNNVQWWGNAPTWVNGAKYNIIFEYVEGVWVGGILMKA